MTTIEERANEYISRIVGHPCIQLDGFIAEVIQHTFPKKEIKCVKHWNDIDAWNAYVQGAIDQKAVDDKRIAELEHNYNERGEFLAAFQRANEHNLSKVKEVTAQKARLIEELNSLCTRIAELEEWLGNYGVEV